MSSTTATTSSAKKLKRSNAARLLQLVYQIDTNVQVVSNECQGLFGEIYSPERVLESIIETASGSGTGGNDEEEDENVGTPRIQTTEDNANQGQGGDDVAYGTTRMMDVQSVTLGSTSFLDLVRAVPDVVTPHEICLEIHNTCERNTVRVRWIDTNGAIQPETHQWDIKPNSTMEQYVQPGHLFVFTFVIRSQSLMESDEETMIGAYRPKRALPSLTPHVVLVEEQPQDGIVASFVIFESILMDKYDSMNIAAYDLDHHLINTTSTERSYVGATIHLLQTILQNIVQHPEEEKYCKLRMTNTKVQKYLVKNILCPWSPMELLHIIGFVTKHIKTTALPNQNNDKSVQEGMASTTTPTESLQTQNDEEEYLVLPIPIPQSTLDLCRQGLKLLDLLSTRAGPGFCLDLAPPTPWQQPSFIGNTSGNGRNGSKGWTSAHRGFITADDRWERAERVGRLRRSGAGRRPNPGEAPSSRGAWGR